MALTPAFYIGSLLPAQNPEGYKGRVCPGRCPCPEVDYLHVHTAFSPYSCLSPKVPFYKDTSPFG